MDENKLNDITDELISNAESVCNSKIIEANAYRDGYEKACDDFRKEVRDEMWTENPINVYE